MLENKQPSSCCEKAGVSSRSKQTRAWSWRLCFSIQTPRVRYLLHKGIFPPQSRAWPHIDPRARKHKICGFTFLSTVCSLQESSWSAGCSMKPVKSRTACYLPGKSLFLQDEGAQHVADIKWCLYTHTDTHTHMYTTTWRHFQQLLLLVHHSFQLNHYSPTTAFSKNRESSSRTSKMLPKISWHLTKSQQQSHSESQCPVISLSVIPFPLSPQGT